MFVFTYLHSDLHADVVHNRNVFNGINYCCGIGWWPSATNDRLQHSINMSHSNSEWLINIFVTKLDWTTSPFVSCHTEDINHQICDARNNTSEGVCTSFKMTDCREFNLSIRDIAAKNRPCRRISCCNIYDNARTHAFFRTLKKMFSMKVKGEYQAFCSLLLHCTQQTVKLLCSRTSCCGQWLQMFSSKCKKQSVLEEQVSSFSYDSSFIFFLWNTHNYRNPHSITLLHDNKKEFICICLSLNMLLKALLLTLLL